MLLRCTKKLRAVLGRGVMVESATAPDPQDWYANLVWVARRKCLLLTHAGPLFTFLAPDVRGKDLRALPGLVLGLVEGELAAENLPTDTFGQLNREGLCIAATTDHQVLGCMNDMAFLAGELIAQAGGLQRANIDAVNRALRRNINSSRPGESFEGGGYPRGSHGVIDAHSGLALGDCQLAHGAEDVGR
ncbi:MAG: hypothetical protein LC799_27265 [Actinobacteria bacterium]|nr:hypothetical protein [Actinomycetota bacterium]